MKSLLPAPYEVRRHADIEYATHYIGYGDGQGPFTPRPLALDWYQPAGAAGCLPAVVLAFGGAFHRGSKEDDVRTELNPTNTSFAHYCQMLAGAGYTAFSIDYRLTQEDPHPGFTPTLYDEKVPTSRIDVVRKELGLPPATEAMLRNEQEAAVDDIASAYRFVTGNAGAFSVDPSRVAIGGYSAGGRIAVTAAMAEDISPAAVVGLSGVATSGVIERYLHSDRPRMPIFIAYGEGDLDYVIPGAEGIGARLSAEGHPHQVHRLPGQSHFYPASAALETTRGNATNLAEALKAFLDEYL